MKTEQAKPTEIEGLRERAQKWLKDGNQCDDQDCGVCKDEVKMLADFAALIQQETREECAKLCEAIGNRAEGGFYNCDLTEAQHDKTLGDYMAKRIRDLQRME